MSGSLFGPTSPKGGGAGGGGPGAIITRDEGVVVDPNTTDINFVGAGVTATSTGPGAIDVTIPGVSSGLWAGFAPAAGFAGPNLTYSVVFPTPHPDGLAYSVGVDEIVVAGSGLSLDLSIENKTPLGFDILLNTAGPVPNLIGVDWQVQGSTTVIPGYWAGSELAAAFVGVPLTATVVFGSPHPSGTNYSVAADELVNPGSGLSLDISIENKTANGFDIVLNAAAAPGLIQVDWQVQPHDLTPGPTSAISLPGVQNILMVDKGTNAIQDGSQQYPFHTIQGALAVAGAGDVVLVYPGTYVEQITPVHGAVLRGVDQAQCILQNVGNGPGDAPIATAAGVSMLIENLSVQTTAPTGGLIHQLGQAQRTAFKDALLYGQIDINGIGAVLLLERNVVMWGQVSVSAGDATTRFDALDADMTGAVGQGVPLVIYDPDPVIRLRRSKLTGMTGNEAVQWSAQNDNLELEWCKVWHGDGVGNNPFGRTGAETPNYDGHHNEYSANPEQGAVWHNTRPYGQRFDTPDEQSFAAANGQAVPANVVGLAFDATVRSVKVNLSVYVNAATPLVEVFELMIVRRGVNWLLTSSTAGDDSDVDFSITGTGQVQYTSANKVGWVSTDIRFHSKVTGV